MGALKLLTTSSVLRRGKIWGSKRAQQEDQVEIGQIGERGLALEGEMDHTGSHAGSFILKIMLKVKTMIGSHAMKEITNQINLDNHPPIRDFSCTK